MSRRVLHGTLLLALLLATFASLGQSRVTRAEPAGVYLALGDSVAVGIGSSLPRERGYVALVGAYFDAWSEGSMRVRNLARNGETAVSMRDDGQLDAALADIDAAATLGAPVRAITLTIGGNDVQALQDLPDANRQSAVEAYAAALDTILTDLRAAAGPDVPLVLTSLWDPSALRDADLDAGAWVAQVNAAMRAAADVHGAVLVDTGAAVAADLAALTYEPTDIHPTNAGHRVIADLVWQGLGMDTTAPTLDVPAALTSVRTPLTLTTHAQDAIGVTAVEVVDAQTVDGKADTDAAPIGISGPYQTEDDVWLVLVDLPYGTTGTLMVTARDAAGNSVEHEVTIAVAAQSSAPSVSPTAADDAEDPGTEGTGTPTP